MSLPVTTLETSPAKTWVTMQATQQARNMVNPVVTKAETALGKKGEWSQVTARETPQVMQLVMQTVTPAACQLGKPQVWGQVS